MGGVASIETANRPGIRQFFLTLYRRISDDRVLAISAGVTFYALLAIFPAIAAVVAVYGLFVSMTTINADLSSVASLLPGGAVQVVGEQIRHVASKGSSTLGLTALAGIAISIWSANSGVKAMFDALNIVLKERETRGFLRLNAVSLLFTLGGLAAALFALAVVIAVPAFLMTLGWSGLRPVINIGRWPILWALVAFAIAVLYRFGPSRDNIQWRWLSWGSGLASLVWLLASMGFSWYAANFGTFDRTYGSLGAVMGFMIWIWISAIIVLVGEELNEILDGRRPPGTGRNRPHPLGTPGKARG
jgi:membrane protein